MSHSDRLDPIAILREEAIAAAIAHGADRCEELAENLVHRYVNRVGGLPVYVRQAKAMERSRLHEDIRRRWTGDNLPDLARETGLSTRHLRRIVEK